MIYVISEENKPLLPSHHTWKMLPHSLVKCTYYSFFTRIEYQSAIRTSFGSVLLQHGLNFNRVCQRGGRCSWSVAKKTRSMYPCRSWSLWTFVVTLLVWHSICHTSQSVFFRAINANPQPAFFGATNVWMNATYLLPSAENMHSVR